VNNALVGRASRHEQVTGLDLFKLQIAIAAGTVFRSRGIPSLALPRHGSPLCTRKIRKTISLAVSRKKFFRPRAQRPRIRLDDASIPAGRFGVLRVRFSAKLIAVGHSAKKHCRVLRSARREYSSNGSKTNTARFRRILVESGFSALRNSYYCLTICTRPSPASALDSLASDAAANRLALWHASPTPLPSSSRRDNVPAGK